MLNWSGRRRVELLNESVVIATKNYMALRLKVLEEVSSAIEPISF